MFRRLDIRIFFALITIALITIGLVIAVTNYQTTAEFNRYVARNNAREQAILSELILTSLEQDNIDNTQMLIETVGATAGQEMALFTADGQVIISSAPNLINSHISPPPAQYFQDATITINGQPAIFAFAQPPFPLTDEVEIHDIIFDKDQIVTVEEIELSTLANDTLIGSSITTRTNQFIISSQPNFTVSPPGNNEQNFLGSLDQTYLLAILLALLCAGLLSYLSTRHLIQPISYLTTAAEQVALGHLNQQVPLPTDTTLRPLAHAFNQMAAALTHQEKLRRHMVTDIAHELRTPLGNIQGYLEAIQDGLLNADDNTIASLHEETLLLKYLVNDLQELALAEAGQLRLNPQPTSLNQIATTALNAITPLAHEHQITLNSHLTPHLPSLEADEDRLAQLLRNLLHNALRHTPPHGQITLTTTHHPTTNHLTLTLHNTGSYIPPEHLPHIFNRFYRADPARDRAAGGAGLGLAICHAIATLHHATLTATSHPQNGTTFILSIPLPPSLN
ncbi:MAG TPA: ATP-binding protein [Anaerolineae bacterium]|nr:ATP-binding protein [Anaerolineae bacterium]